MYRILTAGLVALAAAGCSMGSGTVSSGFAGTAKSTPSIDRGATLGLGGEPTSRAKPAGVQVASANDKIPTGAYEKAPAGALSDRDYGGTRLDPDKARELVNAYRREKGLKPLKLNATLTEAAKAHSRDLAKWDRISHFGSDGSNPWDRVKRVGYNAKLAAENVGTGQASIDEVMKGWKESPGHNKNLLLPDADHMGIALVQDPKTEFKTFWTLVIGSSL